MKLTASIALLYTGFVAGSLQVIAFPRYSLGILILITIALLIAGIVRARGAKKPKGAIPRKLKNRVVHPRKVAKSKLKVAAGRR